MQTLLGGWAGLLSAASGWAVGLVLFCSLYACGGHGSRRREAAGGDRRLAGPDRSRLWTGLYGAMAGGVMALAVALARGYTQDRR